jgi:VIT1/CCC1 family predicted Fe2+/Mn2+ transporter
MTASFQPPVSLVGVASAGAGSDDILTAGLAGLVAGALSMAAAEYVSVSSQADTEKADLRRETAELAADPEAEREELASIYVARGLDRDLALKIAGQLMQKDALAAHARDELGIVEATAARPVQAAVASALAFAAGAALPLAAAYFASRDIVVWTVTAASLVSLALLGVIGARRGRAKLAPATLGIVFWGALALSVTAGAGALFGTVVCLRGEMPPDGKWPRGI